MDATAWSDLEDSVRGLAHGYLQACVEAASPEVRRAFERMEEDAMRLHWRLVRADAAGNGPSGAEWSEAEALQRRLRSLAGPSRAAAPAERLDLAVEFVPDAAMPEDTAFSAAFDGPPQAARAAAGAATAVAPAAKPRPTASGVTADDGSNARQTPGNGPSRGAVPVTPQPSGSASAPARAGSGGTTAPRPPATAGQSRTRGSATSAAAQPVRTSARAAAGPGASNARRGGRGTGR